MSSHGYRIAIVNPTTLVGNELKSILHERGIPYARIELIDTTGEEAGALTEVANEAALVTAASPEAFAGLDLTFFCGPAEKNEQWLALAEGFVIDLSQPSAVETRGVPIVAGVNDHALIEGAGAVSPHPVAIPIALILHQLAQATKVELCTASVIQPASEHGQRGVDELFQQTINALNMQAIPKEVFDRQLAFNLFPAADGSSTESYVVAQVREILGGRTPLSVSITQGTLFHGHSFSLFVKCEEEMTEPHIAELLAKSPAIDIAATDETYATIDAAGRDEVLIGRIHRDPEIPNAFWLWAVVDNLRRSSALNAVLIAEAMFARFGEKPN
jgi:aspartate-semialdehyde dehydrogenase